MLKVNGVSMSNVYSVSIVAIDRYTKVNLRGARVRPLPPERQL